MLPARCLLRASARRCIQTQPLRRTIMTQVNQAPRSSFLRVAALGSAVSLAVLAYSYRQISEAESPKHAKKTQNGPETSVHNLPAEFFDVLLNLLGDRLVVLQNDRDAHGKDNSYHDMESPDAVAYPHTTEEIVAIVKLCQKHQVPIIPYGSGTSLEGHTLAHRGGLTLDFRSMNQIIALHKDDMDIVVQPGVIYEDLNDQIRQYGLFFPLDPGPGASIGGMVGTSCSGTNAVRHGTMKDMVLSLKVVLPNGEIVKTRSRAKKSSAGYDLTHLFIGAEGTLGIVTEVTLKLKRIPEKTAVALVTFPNDITAASKAVVKIVQQGISIGRVELMDGLMMKAVNMSSGTSYDEQPTLLFEFSGSADEISSQVKSIEKIARDQGSDVFKFADEQEERDSLWLARKVALWSSKILKPNAEVWITDVCVPISRLSDIMSETQADLATSPLPAPLVAHAGDGNFHLFILFDPKSQEELKEAQRLNHNLVKRAIQMEGTCTGEHGVGVGKRDYLSHELGPEAVELMRLIKTSIDPNNILNPGKIIPDLHND